MVSLDAVKRSEPLRDTVTRLQTAGTHFNIFQDVHGSPFLPLGIMNVTYETEGVANKVHHGNIISPTQVSSVL